MTLRTLKPSALLALGASPFSVVDGFTLPAPYLGVWEARRREQPSDGRR